MTLLLVFVGLTLFTGSLAATGSLLYGLFMPGARDQETRAPWERL